MTIIPADRAIQALLAEATAAVGARDWCCVLRLTAVVEELDPRNRVADSLRQVADTMRAGPCESAPEARSSPLEPRELSVHTHHAHDLATVLKSAADLVPFSAVAMKLIALLDDELSSADDVARLASTDPALTARILASANSAYYRRRFRVATMRDAVTLLGAREVQSLVVATCVVGSMPRPQVIDHHDFWRASIAVGLLADTIARAEGDLSGQGFTAGILHKVGLLVLDRYCPEGLREVVALTGPGRRRLDDREALVFGFTDAQLGAALATQWHLPRSVVQAIELHGSRQDEVHRQTVTSALIRARIFARARGISDGLEVSPVRDPGDGFLPAQAQARLNEFGRWEDFLARIDSLLQSAVS